MKDLSLTDPALLRSAGHIDGEWAEAEAGRSFAVTDPATADILAQVADLGVAETRRAIDAAARAFPAWKARTAAERAAVLHRWHDLILESEDDLARLMTAEQGKPFPEALGEVRYGAAFVRWFAEEAKRIYGDVIPTHSADRRVLATKEPIGVVAAITPWNFPNAMITRKVAPALAVGCTAVVKPAAETPLSALALAELGERAGLPPGVFNVIPTSTSAAVGGELTANPVVRKLSFTGSTEVGKILMRQCADTVKKVSLELGGNAPFIVFDDCDLDAAVEGAIVCKYRNTGQTCVCANRFFVQSGVYDSFVEQLVHKVSELRVGSGFEGGCDVGPLINEAAVEKVDELLADAVGQGATVAAGGARHALGGTFFEPTVLTGVNSKMRVHREEIFGPVAPIYRFDTEAEAVAAANDTQYGLAAYFYTRDLGRAWRVSEGLEYGIVGVNTGLISSEVAPFGGVKESGIGREGSKYGAEDFLEIKYVCLGGIGGNGNQ